MRNGALSGEIISLLITLVFAAAVNKHFRNRHYPQHLKYRTFWPRFWTPTIDAVVLWPFISLVPALWLEISPETYPVALVTVYTGLFQFAYSIYFHTRYGATVGKMRCGVRVVDVRTEGPITYRQAFLRDSVPLVLLILLIIFSVAGIEDMAEGGRLPREVLYIPMIYLGWFALEVLTMLTNAKRRALHDFIAGTVVVRTNLIRADHPRRFSHMRITK